MHAKTVCGMLVVFLLAFVARAQSIKNAIPDVARPLPLSSVRVTGGPTSHFYDMDYKIPAELVKDKSKVTVRFQASGGNETATVYSLRIIRVE